MEYFSGTSSPVFHMWELQNASQRPSFFLEAEDGIREPRVTGVQTCALPICQALEDAGHATVVAHVDDLKRGRIDMVEFVEQHHPDVIVYDVAPPYDTNWTFLRVMRNSKVMQGRAFVVTTTNKKALDELIGPSDVVELLCKPYDLEQIVKSVNRALATQIAPARTA